jgi:hypothetical protein
LKQKPIEVAGFGVVFTDKQWAFYFVENKDRQELVDFNQPRFDYTQTEWYQSAITGASGITKPFTDAVTGDTVIAFYQPFYSDQDRTTISGVVFATQSIEHLRHILSTLYLGTAGYWILADAAGTILIHPNANIVKAKTSLDTLAEETSDITLRTVAQQTAAGISSISSYANPYTNQRAWLSSALIPAAGNWLLFGIFDVSPHNDTVRRQLIHIIIATLFTLFFLILFFLTRTSFSVWAWWTSSGIFSVIIALAIASLWTVTALYPHYKQEAVQQVQNKISLYQFLDRFITRSSETTKKSDETDFDYYLRYRYKTGKFVPTGFLIQDINFISKDQIEFVGIIWQRYFDGIHDGISRGFILQQLTSKAEIEEMSRSKIGKEETIVWLVHAQLNQIMSYHNFPFDVKNIHIQVSHKDFDKNIILVPDLDSYSMLNPETLPGVSNQAHLAGWQLHSSFFGYEIVDYHTTFGMYSYGPFGIWKELDKSRVPELHFIVQAKRYLLETLTIDVITLLIIALILFILLFTYKEREFSNTLSTFGAVLFSTILAQQYFKVKIPSEEFVYFEAFYFIMYLAILLTLTFTLLDYFEAKIQFIRYRNNFMARLLFWPGLLGIVCLVTVLYLY